MQSNRTLSLDPARSAQTVSGPSGYLRRSPTALLSVVAVAGLLASGCAEREPFDAIEEVGSVAQALPTGPLALLSGDNVATSLTIPSFDGHLIPVTIYRPLEAGPASPVPVLLHSHGWSGSRTSEAGAFRAEARAGFGVVSIDMRGHGDARWTSVARVHHIDYEVRDVSAVIDAIAALDWVVLDDEGDPRIGALGGSYGGGYQLLTAIFDPRLDAIAPEITWNSLPQSLAPNGALKSLWVDALFGGGTLLATLHPDLDTGIALGDATNELPDGSLPGTPDLLGQFTDSSPRSYPGAIAVPTMLAQGASDTLFNLNEAAANFAAIEATGAPVRLMTYLGGHLLPIVQPEGGPSPCGGTRSRELAWYQTYLRGVALDLGPKVCLALEDGTSVSGDAFPLPSTQNTTISLQGTASIAQVAPSWHDFTVLTASSETVIAGIPRLQATASTLLGLDAIVYFTLVVVAPDGSSHVINAQVTPARLPRNLKPGNKLALPLMGIGTRLHPGDRLILRASSINDQYIHNAGRVPGLATLSQLKLTLPIIP